MKKKTQKPQSKKESKKFALEQEEQHYQAITINPEEYLAKPYWSGEDCERLFFVMEVSLENYRTPKQKKFLKSLTNAIKTGELINLNKHDHPFNSKEPFFSTLQALFDPKNLKSWINLPKTKKYFDHCAIKTPKEVVDILLSVKPSSSFFNISLKKGRKPSPFKDPVKNKVKEILNQTGDISTSKLANSSDITKILSPKADHSGTKEYDAKEYLEEFGIPRRRISDWIREAKKECIEKR